MPIWIQNNAGKKFEFEYASVTRVGLTKSGASIDFGLTGMDSEDNVALNLSGMKDTISLSFKLFNDNSEDRSKGTHTSTVISAKEQILYLWKTVITTLPTEQYTINIDLSMAENLLQVTGIIDTFTLDFDPNKPNYGEGSLIFKVGKNPLVG